MSPEQLEQPEPNEPANEPEANGSGVRLLPYAAAAPLLGLSPDAVRMRCRRGKLVCGHGPEGAGVIWPQPAPAERPNGPRTNEHPNAHPERRSVRSGDAGAAAVLAERVDQLAARLAVTEAASAARDDAERELRVLLARATAPALAAGGNRDIAGQAPDTAGAATGGGSDVPASRARRAPDGPRHRRAGRTLGAWLRRVLGR